MSLQAYNSAVIRDITVTPTKGNFIVNSLNTFIILDLFFCFCHNFSLYISYFNTLQNKLPKNSRESEDMKILRLERDVLIIM